MPINTETYLLHSIKKRKNALKVSLLLTIIIMVMSCKLFYDELITQSLIQEGIKSFNLNLLFLPTEDMSNLIPTINLDLILLLLLLSFINVIALIMCIALSRPSKFMVVTNIISIIILLAIGIIAIFFKSEATSQISKVFSAILLGKKELLEGITGLETTLVYFLSIALILNLIISCIYCCKIKPFAVANYNFGLRSISIINLSNSQFITNDRATSFGPRAIYINRH